MGLKSEVDGEWKNQEEKALLENIYSDLKSIWFVTSGNYDQIVHN